jgi:hypothetical protein
MKDEAFDVQSISEWPAYPALLENRTEQNRTLYSIPDDEEPVVKKRKSKKEPGPNPLDAGFDEFWKIYPPTDPRARSNRSETLAAWVARQKQGYPPEDMILAAKAYAESREASDPKFVKGAQVFIGRNCHFDGWLDGCRGSGQKLDANGLIDGLIGGVYKPTGSPIYDAALLKECQEKDAKLKADKEANGHP